MQVCISHKPNRATNRWNRWLPRRPAYAERVQVPNSIVSVSVNGRLTQRMRHLWPSLLGKIYSTHHDDYVDDIQQKKKIFGRFDWIFMLIEHTGYTENRHWKRQWSKYIGKILPSHTMARTQSHDDVDNSQQFQNTLPLSAISIPCDSCDNDDALVYVLGACKAMPISFSKAFRLAHSVPVHQMHSLIVFDYS